MWYVFLYIYYLPIVSYPIHVFTNLHLILYRLSTKQMPVPFLILKLVASNNNKIKHSKPTF